MIKMIRLVFFIAIASISTKNTLASDSQEFETHLESSPIASKSIPEKLEYEMKYQLAETLLKKIIQKTQDFEEDSPEVILKYVIEGGPSIVCETPGILGILQDPAAYKKSVEIFMVPFGFLSTEELQVFYLNKCHPELFSITEEQFNLEYCKQRDTLNHNIKEQSIKYQSYLTDRWNEYMNYATY